MNWQPRTLFIASLLTVLLTAIAQSQQPTWGVTGSLNTARTRHTATLLANGKVLIVGGVSITNPCCTPATNAELYDATTGKWTLTGNPITPRYDHAAVRLANGKVLIVGGDGRPIVPTQAEIYDPATGAWSSAGNPGVFLPVPKAVLLTDGRVLVTGVFGANGNKGAVIYNPMTNAWTAAASMNADHFFHSMVLLPNGKVLVTGGMTLQIIRTAELYDPDNNRWALTGDMAATRTDHQMVLLANGKVLAAGGIGESPTTFTSAELYDSNTGQWTLTPSPNSFRLSHTLTALPNGKALVAGGQSVVSTELYAPDTGLWTPTPGLRDTRQRHTATLLLNGKVLIAGGETLSIPGSNGIPFSSVELFDSGTPNLASVSAASFVTDQLAPEAVVAAFGSNLAASTQIASGLPLPTELAGVSVRVKDFAGVERAAPLFFVSPTQINYQIPLGTMNGAATIMVSSGSIGIVEIFNVSPGLFSADASGAGLAAATVLRVKANGEQVYEPVARFDSTTGKFVAVPIEVSNPAEQVFLLAFGTGFRRRSDLANVTAKIGDSPTEVLFAGAQGDFVGLDQCNIRLLPNLAGRGEVIVALTVDGKSANTVKVVIK
ncbi:MAG: kelch repeat-containing protein [Acidobacteriota bacterium]|nr:kelch repeat-containing protein [Acidobacteriota bacterium]